MHNNYPKCAPSNMCDGGTIGEVIIGTSYSGRMDIDWVYGGVVKTYDGHVIF